ncbi:MAG: caspase family protein [Candidatus Latescibacterota bacterium]
MSSKLKRRAAQIACMSLLLLLSFSMAAGAIDRGLLMKMKTEQRIALIIGNGAYRDTPLTNPANDARAMSMALKACGFRVIEKTNCDRGEMRQAIREFGDLIRQGGVGVFYYAGHGIQVKGENYLVPVGAGVQAEDEVEDECILASSVLRKMESAGNRVNIVIMDACRNNPFARSFRSGTRGLARMDAATGSIVAYAAGDAQNGLYTSMLLKYLREPGVQIEDVFKNVRRDVMAASSETQVPWESSSLTGDFYFVLPESEESLLPPTPLEKPATGDFSLYDLEQEAEQIEENKTAWAAQLREMQSAFDQVTDLEKGDLRPRKKAAAWERFLEAFEADNPYSHSDDTMRQKAAQQAAYWVKEATRPKPKPTQPPQVSEDMVWIPGGAFQMGSNDGDGDEKPVHRVRVDGFYMDKTEVTVGAIQKIPRSDGTSRFTR